MGGCDYENSHFSVPVGSQTFRDGYDQIDWNKGKAPAEPVGLPSLASQNGLLPPGAEKVVLVPYGFVPRSVTEAVLHAVAQRAAAGQMAPERAAEVVDLVKAREQKGIETYGESLKTWNGRDAHKDCEEELLDALQYNRQTRMQQEDLVQALVAAHELLALALRELQACYDATALPGMEPAQEDPAHRVTVESLRTSGSVAASVSATIDALRALARQRKRP